MTSLLKEVSAAKTLIKFYYHGGQKYTIIEVDEARKLFFDMASERLPDSFLIEAEIWYRP